MVGQVDPSTISTASDWAQFGLAGLVIFALFGLVVWVVKLNSHERKEWRESIEASNQRLIEAINEMKLLLHQNAK